MIQKWQRAFTLIELLIVVAIIAILAAIAVPNFLEAQVRSKISRLRADMRTIATAMEAYFTDHNGYPLHIDYDTGPIPLNARPWFAALTTPVAYLTSMPTDPFFDPRTLGGDVSIGSSGSWIHYEALWNTWGRGVGGNPPYDWMPDTWGPWVGFVPQMRARGFWYTLRSPGPDRLVDFNRTVGGQRLGLGAFYDPTNGTVSVGDIVRLGPGASDFIVF